MDCIRLDYTESQSQLIGWCSRSLSVLFVYPGGSAQGLIDEGLSLREQIIKHNPRSLSQTAS